MDLETLIPLLTGPFGALIILALGMGALTIGKLIAPWWALEREMARTERWEDIAGKAINQTTEIFSQTTAALRNHEKIIANQQQMLDLLKEVHREQASARDREDWEHK